MLSLKRFITEFKKIKKAWSLSSAGTFGASVAYYTVFSIAPLLVIAIAITGIFLDGKAAEAAIIVQFTSTFGQSGGEFIQNLIQAKTTTNTGVILSIIGFIVLLFGATGIFKELQKALDTIFESLPTKIEGGFLTTLRKRILSVGMVISVGFLLFVSLVLSTIITAFSHRFSDLVSGIEVIARVVEFSVSFALISFFLSLMYKFLPNKRIAWKPALAGGLIAGLLFTISKYCIGLYLASTTAFTGYGAAAALVLLIFWTYYMSQIFFFSAVLVKVYLVKRLK